MNFLKRFFILTLLGIQPAFSAGFHEATFDSVSAGTIFFGVAPVFAASTYINSSYSSWGFQGMAGFDHSFIESFGVRGYVSYSHTTGNNSANSSVSYESVTTNDVEAGVMATFPMFAVGGGVISRGASFDYITNQTETLSSSNGLLKFAKASLDFTSKNDRVGFSVSESYIFGNVGQTSVYKLTEFRTLVNVLFLLGLK